MNTGEILMYQNNVGMQPYNKKSVISLSKKRLTIKKKSHQVYL